MSFIESVIMVSIPLVFSAIYVEIATRRVQKRLISWAQSTNGLETMASLGAAFASGAMTQLKFGSPSKKGVKLGPFHIPQEIIDAVIAKAASQYLPSLFPQQQPPSE